MESRKKAYRHAKKEVAWPQWWSFEDKDQLKVDFYAKISFPFFTFEWVGKNSTIILESTVFQHFQNCNWSYLKMSIPKTFSTSWYKFSNKSQKYLDDFRHWELILKVRFRTVWKTCLKWRPSQIKIIFRSDVRAKIYPSWMLFS